MTFFIYLCVYIKIFNGNRKKNKHISLKGHLNICPVFSSSSVSLPDDILCMSVGTAVANGGVYICAVHPSASR